MHMKFIQVHLDL